MTTVDDILLNKKQLRAERNKRYSDTHKDKLREYARMYQQKQRKRRKEIKIVADYLKYCESIESDESDNLN
jgi:hypothetical protein